MDRKNRDRKKKGKEFSNENVANLFSTFIPVIQKFGQMASDGQFNGTFNYPTDFQTSTSYSSDNDSVISETEESHNNETMNESLNIPNELADLEQDKEGKQYLKNSYSSETWIDKLGRRRVVIKRTYKNSNGINKVYEKKVLGDASHEIEWEQDDKKKKVLKDNYKGVDSMEFHRLWKQVLKSEPITPKNSPASQGGISNSPEPKTYNNIDSDHTWTE